MRAMKIILFVLILLVIGTGIYFFSVSKNKSTNDKGVAIVNSTPPTEAPIVNMTNPSSVYCNEHNGRSVIRTASDGSQLGVCVFADGKECDEWKYFRGECSADDSLTPGTQKAVQDFLANKYNKPLSDVKVTVEKEAGGFAAGSVRYG